MIKSLSSFLFLFLLTLSSTVSAIQDSCCCSQPHLEAKAGYFFFSNSTLRKIYNKNGLDLQLCASYPLWDFTSRWTLNAYGAVEYFHKSGKSLHDHQKTSLWSIPVNLGLKPVYAVCHNLDYYLAVGPRYFYIHQHNHSSYVYKNKSKNGLGFFVNTGFNYLLQNCLILDVFGEYSYARTHFHGKNSRVYTRSIQVGGFTFGGGLGYAF